MSKNRPMTENRVTRLTALAGIVTGTTAAVLTATGVLPYSAELAPYAALVVAAGVALLEYVRPARVATRKAAR